MESAHPKLLKLSDANYANWRTGAGIKIRITIKSPRHASPRLTRRAVFASVGPVKGSRYYFSLFAFRFYWPDVTGLRLH
jgi:hypothetical protein